MKTAIWRQMTTISMPLSNSPQEKISALVKTNDTVVLGLSGGPDSVFLFHLLLKMPNAPRLVAAHVNYGLRGRKSLQDRLFVEKLCAGRKVPLEILDLEKTFVQKKSESGNLEEKCRQIRYLFLEEVRRRHHAKAILVAHQLNDQLETFLLNLTRGSSLKGFRAMRDYDPKRHLLRPLLEISKQEILDWLKKHRLSWRIDQSNFSEKFSRNLIRSQVMPVLEKINPAFLRTAGNSLLDLTENLKLAENLLNGWLEKNLATDGKKLSFPLDDFLRQPDILQKHILRELYGRLHGGSLTRPALKEILLTLGKKQAGLRKEFGPGTWLKIIRLQNIRQTGGTDNKRIVVLERKFN